MANQALWKLVNVATAAHVAAYKATGGRFLLGPLGAARTLREMGETEIQVGSEHRRVTVREATPEEKERLWPRLVEIWPSYEGYQKRTERQIPLAILSPAGS